MYNKLADWWERVAYKIGEERPLRPYSGIVLALAIFPFWLLRKPPSAPWQESVAWPTLMGAFIMSYSLPSAELKRMRRLPQWNVAFLWMVCVASLWKIYGFHLWWIAVYTMLFVASAALVWYRQSGREERYRPALLRWLGLWRGFVLAMVAIPFLGALDAAVRPGTPWQVSLFIASAWGAIFVACQKPVVLKEMGRFAQMNVGLLWAESFGLMLRNESFKPAFVAAFSAMFAAAALRIWYVQSRASHATPGEGAHA